MRILIVEDEKDLVQPVKRFLEGHGFSVDCSFDGKDGYEMMRLNDYDCVLLDLNLPKLDGIEVARKIRAEENTVPIIMVTARGQMDDKLTGFEKGADDYIVKPFELAELLARIKAVVKRNSINKIEKLEIGPYTLVVDRNVLEDQNGNLLELSNKETGVLEYMIRNKGKIVSTEELLEHVWDSEIDFFTDTVKTHVKTIRQKLGEDRDLIRTVRGKGYIIDK